MTSLPYLASPGNVPRALEAIKRAATPPRVSQDFVKTKLAIPGSSGDQMATFLKRIGFANSDGTPTELYREFRTSNGGRAVAKAIKLAYAPLYELNEYMHECGESELKDLIIQATGLATDSRPVGLIYSTMRGLMEAADFDEAVEAEQDGAAKEAQAVVPQMPPERSEGARTKSESNLGLNIGYTINLNLPETTDIEVFNAIFKSLKEHLLRSDDV